MGLFQILGRLAFDTKPARTELDKFEGKASSFAERVEKKVGKKLDKAFGTGLIVGAVIGQIKGLVHLAQAAGEYSEKVDEIAKRNKVGEETAQALSKAADQAGQSVEEFLKAASESHKIDETIARLAQLRKEGVLTGEQLDALNASNGFWSGIKTKAVQLGGAFAAGKERFLAQSIRSFQILKDGGALSPSARWEQAGKELDADEAQQEKNRRQQNKDDDARLRELLTEKDDSKEAKRKEAAKTFTGLNNWQQIGAYVGVPGDIILKETQKTNAILQRIESLSREQITVLNSKGQLFS